MKYLALLKDSLLEAIDAKVIYVTIGFSLFVTLVVASLSFKPVPAEEALNSIIQQFGLVYRDRGQSLRADFHRVGYKLQDLQQLNEATEPQAGDYRFVLSAPDKDLRMAAAFWDLPADSERSPANLAPASDAVVEEFLKSQFEVFGGVDVTQVRKVTSDQTDHIALEIETKGTKGVRGWQHDPCLFFGAIPLKPFRTSLGNIVYFIEDSLVNGFGAWIGILIGVVITSFFIPNMLRKGTIDLLLAKPIHRTTLLIYKYIGGLTFVFLNAAVAVFGIWLAIGLRSGIWAWGFLLSILIITFFFAILYAVSALFAVLTRSVVVSILMTCGVWFLLWAVGFAYSALELLHKDPGINKELPIPEWIFTSVEKIHYVLPRAKDLDLLTTKLLVPQLLTEGELRNPKFKLDRLPPVTWGESLTVSGIFIGLVLGAACLRFTWADY